MATSEPRGRHLMVGDVRIHLLAYAGPGDAAPIVLIPGITSPAITWDFVSRRLAAFAPVIALDNRGRGLSSGGADLDYGLPAYAADALGVIAELGLAKPVILGHSMGARIALELAAAAPDAVGPVILADPPVTGPGRRDYPVPLQWYLDGLAAACRGEPTDTSNPLLARWTPEQIAQREEWLPTCDPAAIEASWRGFHEEDIHALMPKVRAPAMLIYAEDGNTVTDADAAEICELIPDCRSVRIDGVGHMIPWDDLDMFVTAVEGFIDSMGAAA